MWDDVGREVRFAAQGLLMAPLFTTTAALSLAIAIGANATIALRYE